VILNGFNSKKVLAKHSSTDEPGQVVRFQKDVRHRSFGRLIPQKLAPPVRLFREVVLSSTIPQSKRIGVWAILQQPD